MPIDLKVVGDENSCRSAADQLMSLADGITQGGTAFHTARSESETLWTGQAGDAFRARMQPAGEKTDDVADSSRTAAQNLHAFADDLTTVKARMTQARNIAASAGLTVNGDTIADPVAPPSPPAQPSAPGGNSSAPNPGAVQAQQDYQRQQAAFQQARETVSDARKLEQSAHNTLEQKMNAWDTMLKDAADQRCWIAAGAVTGMVGTAISQADKWGKIASARNAQVELFKRIAANAEDPFEEAAAARAAGVFEPGATKAQAALDGNLKWTEGLSGTKVGDVLSASLKDIPSIGSKLPEIAEKLPVVGGVIALGQTAWDSRNAKNPGDVAKAAGADLGGYVAGSLATEGTLAGFAAVGLAGGPVTLAAVGVGVGVAYGVGELVNHWPEVSHWAENTASDIGHGVSSAAHSVGHFFSSIF